MNPFHIYLESNQMVEVAIMQTDIYTTRRSAFAMIFLCAE